jgi:N-acyl-D-amino-acid deacylase
MLATFCCVEDLPVRSLSAVLPWSWQSFGEFLDRLDAARPAVNVVPLVGHGPLRIAAMGMDARRPTAAELAAMRAGLAEALAAGAWGLSTGLVYPPGVFADRDELLEIGRELQRAEALYDSHIRNEGDELLEAVDEALAIGERLGIRVQVSHLKATGRRNVGRVGAAIERLEAARARGVRAHCDVYPYTAGSTFLHQVLPPWVKDGGTERMLERLRAEEHRRRIRRELETGLPGWSYHLEAGDWHNILIASVIAPELRWAEGRRVSELAAQAGADPLDFTLDLLLRDRGATVMVIFLMDEADVRTVLRYRAAGIGSDQLGVTSAEARVHPRAYGTFARVLGWAARDAGLLPLEEAVRRMTGLPAEILGLADRGRVAPGAVADLVLFDPATVRDAATYEAPTRRARGVEYVLVGGHFAIDRGEARDLRRGRVLRRAARGASPR